MSDGFEIGTDGPSRILACVDGSPTSMRAAAWAAGMARRQGSQLAVTFVAADATAAAMAPQYTVDLQNALDELTEQLRAEVTANAAHAGIAVTFIAARGDPYAEICRIAQQERVDAVVVGASAQAGHRLVGSLAVRLVRAGKWPVTVVP